MAATASNTITLGTTAPAFSLPDAATSRDVTLDDVRGEKATVVLFICNHCPFVKHVNHQLVAVANDYRSRGVGFVAISANDAEAYPDDGPEMMAEVAQTLGYPFPYLYDASQDVARAYDAACTPDLFVYDSALKLAYRGQLDDARPRNDEPVDGHDLRAALDALIAGRPVAAEQKPSVGCSIKWRAA